VDGDELRNTDSSRTEYTNGQLWLNCRINELGFSTEMEREFLPFQVDIYVHETHSVVEYDGMGHWKKRDQKRDYFLEKTYGLKVLRITPRMKSIEVREKLVEFLSACAETAEERRKVGNT